MRACLFLCMCRVTKARIYREVFVIMPLEAKCSYIIKAVLTIDK